MGKSLFSGSRSLSHVLWNSHLPELCPAPAVMRVSWYPRQMVQKSRQTPPLRGSQDQRLEGNGSVKPNQEAVSLWKIAKESKFHEVGQRIKSQLQKSQRQRSGCVMRLLLPKSLSINQWHVLSYSDSLDGGSH